MGFLSSGFAALAMPGAPTRATSRPVASFTTSVRSFPTPAGKDSVAARCFAPSTTGTLRDCAVESPTPKEPVERHAPSTRMAVVASSLAPLGSLARRRAVKAPGAAYACDACGVNAVLPSPKSHA